MELKAGNARASRRQAAVKRGGERISKREQEFEEENKKVI